jgi:hypothetical protein
MSATGDRMPMNDQQTILRLVGDVAGVKADVRHMAEAQQEQWKKLDRCIEQIGEVNRKLDQVVGHEERLEAVEDGVEDYHTIKNRAVSMVVGAGLGFGGIGGAISAWVSKWFN